MKLTLALACVIPTCLALALGGRGSSAQVAPRGVVQLKRSQQVPARSTLQFLVLGDWGDGSQQQKDVAEAMARYSEAHRGTAPMYEDAVDLVVLTGDNFYESGVKSVDDPQWQEKFETIYDPIRLPMPFLAVLGNHDWGKDPLAQIQYGATRRVSVSDTGSKSGPAISTRRTTRWQMDGFWYQRQFGQVIEGEKSTPLADFFFIDTDLWTLNLGALADKQMAWLQDGLENSRAKWQFVVAHHPLYSDGAHGREAEILSLREKLSPLLAKWGVDAFVCGHDHDLQHIEIPGHPTSFIVSEAGAKLRPRATNGFGPFYASEPGFVAITLSPGSMQGEVIDAKNQTLHKWQRLPAPPQP